MAAAGEPSPNGDVARPVPALALGSSEVDADSRLWARNKFAELGSGLGRVLSGCCGCCQWHSGSRADPGQVDRRRSRGRSTSSVHGGPESGPFTYRPNERPGPGLGWEIRVLKGSLVGAVCAHLRSIRMPSTPAAVGQVRRGYLLQRP